MDSSPYSTTSEIFAVGGEDYLKEGHTPTTLPERQDEILKLRRSLKPAARGAGAENTFLSGKAGQGRRRPRRQSWPNWRRLLTLRISI